MAIEDVVGASKERLGSMISAVDGGVGADVTYDEKFEAMRLEVEKLTSMSGGKVDWGSIASSAEEILSEKSKDFRVAVYYAAAKAQLDGIVGLLDGLVLITELNGAFWEAMYPALKRPKARGNLMPWFGDIAAPAVSAHKPVSRDADLVGALDQLSRGIDGDLRDKLADNYGGMGGLRDAIRNLVQSVPKEAPPPPPPPPPPEPGESAPVEASAPVATGGVSVTSITDASSADAALSEVGQILRQAADAYRASDPASAAAFRVLRVGMWLELSRTPPAENNVTLVPPPPIEMLKPGLDGLASSQDWMGLINAGENMAREYVLWLDPHRYVCMAMDRLGALFLDAKKAVVGEVAAMLSRAPGMPALCFNDGTPFADAQTRAWIDSEVASAIGGGGGGGVPAMSPIESALLEARGMMAGGRLDEALALVSKTAAGAATAAERFRGRLGLARLCLDAGQFVVARAQLEGLDRVVEAHRLMEWEPALCAELYAALYMAHRALNQMEVPPDVRAREERAFERLCQLDAAAALKATVPPA